MRCSYNFRRLSFAQLKVFEHYRNFARAPAPLNSESVKRLDESTEKLFQFSDENKDGYISYEEFVPPKQNMNAPENSQPKKKKKNKKSPKIEL